MAGPASPRQTCRAFDPIWIGEARGTYSGCGCAYEHTGAFVQMVYAAVMARVEVRHRRARFAMVCVRACVLHGGGSLTKKMCRPHNPLRVRTNVETKRTNCEREQSGLKQPSDGNI